MELNRIFGEVRCDYFDEEGKCWCVDAWYTPLDDPEDERGTVAARIYPETLEVIYTNPEYKKDQLVNEEIRAKLKDILADWDYTDRWRKDAKRLKNLHF